MMRVKLKYIFLSLAVAMICAIAVYPAVHAAAATQVMPSAGAAYLKVVDISQWNDSVSSSTDDIDFPALKTQVDAVYIRAFGYSNGIPYIDMQAVRYAQSAQSVNLLYGFYYHYIPSADLANAKSQAQAYYNFVKNYAFSCVPALDVEENPNNLSKSELAASVKAFADEFKALSGFDLMIYSSPDFIVNNFDPTQNWIAYKLWIAHYNVSAPMEGISSTWMPVSKWCWERWDMWQYTSSGTLSSIPNSSGGFLDIGIATDNILLSTPTATMNLESPTLSNVLGGDVSVSGWTLSHSGVSRVDIYLDNYQWIGSSSMNERPDVQAAANSNGRYNDGLHSGFAYQIDAGCFTVGTHSLKLAAVNRNGTATWFEYIINVGPESAMNLETPNLAISSGDIAVSGWALSHAGISRIDVYADDNRYIGSTYAMLQRPDVNNAMNGSGLYKDGLNSGFNYIIDASKLTPGSHTIKVAAVSKDGSAQWVYRTILVGPESKMNLESPTVSLCSGDVAVSGWALSHAGITRIDIYVDNNRYIGSQYNMLQRPDVNSVMNSNGIYKNGLYSGFNYIIDAGQLTNGAHVLRVAAIANDGAVQWYVKSITVGPESKMNLETPTSSVCTGDVNVSGWAVSHAGISRVDIYVDDNRFFGSTSNMLERPDVNSAINGLGQYKDAIHSGFNTTINASLLTPGDHILRIAAISNDGDVQWLTETITIGPASLINIESPALGQTLGEITVSGWALSHAGITRIDIYADVTQYIGTAYMLERPDVNNIMNGSGLFKDGLKSGFSYKIDAGRLTPGEHVLNVAAISNDGSVQWSVVKIVVSTNS